MVAGPLLLYTVHRPPSTVYRPLSLFFLIFHHSAVKMVNRDRKSGNSGGMPSGTDTYRLKNATNSDKTAASATILPLTLLRRLAPGRGIVARGFSGS
jgi:hypothetical protein